MFIYTVLQSTIPIKVVVKDDKNNVVHFDFEG